MRLKNDLNKQYREWQNKINNGRIGTIEDHRSSHEIKISFMERIENHRKCMENSLSALGNYESKRLVLKLLIKEIDRSEAELHDKFLSFYILNDRMIFADHNGASDSDTEADEEKQQGLTPQRVQLIEQFTADESHVGDQCVICMEDVEIGRNMMRLDCDGQHTFCQVCIEGWFANKTTCPVCRHEF